MADEVLRDTDYPTLIANIELHDHGRINGQTLEGE
jgi:hypothetical protein